MRRRTALHSTPLHYHTTLPLRTATPHHPTALPLRTATPRHPTALPLRATTCTAAQLHNYTALPPQGKIKVPADDSAGT